jgi:hypothetical protein
MSLRCKRHLVSKPEIQPVGADRAGPPLRHRRDECESIRNRRRLPVRSYYRLNASASRRCANGRRTFPAGTLHGAPAARRGGAPASGLRGWSNTAGPETGQLKNGQRLAAVATVEPTDAP